MSENPSLEDRIVDVVEKYYSGVSFGDLKRAFGEEMNGDYTFGDQTHNIIFWAGLSSPFVDALIKVLKEKRIYMNPANILIYLYDGVMLRLPIARRITVYKTKHWLPISFSMKIEEKKKRKSQKIMKNKKVIE